MHFRGASTSFVSVLLAAFMATSFSSQSPVSGSTTVETSDSTGQMVNHGYDDIARRSIRISLEDFSLLSSHYLLKASERWQFYRAEAEKEAGPYETSEETSARIDSALVVARDYLSSLYLSAGSWCFTVLVRPDEVTYDADDQEVYVKLPDVMIPSESGEAAVQGIYRGHEYPNMHYAMEPLWRHVYQHETVRRKHFLSGRFRVPLPIDRAKMLDVVNNRGVVEVTIRFSYKSMQDGVLDCSRPVRFPSVQLLSSRWIVSSDTLRSFGLGTCREGSTMTVPGDSRVFGESPEVSIQYAFLSTASRALESELSSTVFDLLGFNLICTNSDSPFSKPMETGTVAAYGEPAGAPIYVDGILKGQMPLIIDSLAPGWHYMTVKKEFHVPRRSLVRVSQGDTNSVEVRMTQFEGVWTIYNCRITQGLERGYVQGVLNISQVGGEVTVRYENCSYECSLGNNAQLWTLLAEPAFECLSKSTTRRVQRDKCIGFNFSTEKSPSSSYDHLFIFISEDGKLLLGKKFHRDRSHIGSKLYSDLREAATFYAVPR
ncbi:MAG: PEGA domain-containing protein [Candidatus Zixiibacteriota bacterium]